MANFKVTWANESHVIENVATDRDAWTAFCAKIKKSPSPKTGVVELINADGSLTVVYKYDPKAREKAQAEQERVQKFKNAGPEWALAQLDDMRKQLDRLSAANRELSDKLTETGKMLEAATAPAGPTAAALDSPPSATDDLFGETTSRPSASTAPPAQPQGSGSKGSEPAKK